ncbi:jg1210 [Pararge aegeria aegeria]|uniref:Jg1210 protein n=1 Tax=Pararge aegeria aegeria TaxID=348720 RepID=A0A8S4RDB8_9NEOP|nr:jg1210 [Pararge aegeria aegeria]
MKRKHSKTPEPSEEQLNNRHSTAANQKFTRCLLRFNGEHNYDKVEEFITGVEVFKQISQISDEEALLGLPLLLKGSASTWWQGIRSEVKDWSAAIDNLRSFIDPKQQPYEIYMEIFASPQGENEEIDTFLCRKRALLGQLPAARHKEEEEIDLIYGLLKLKLRKNIARSAINTFADLLEKARHLESLEQEIQKPLTETTPVINAPTKAPRKKRRCLFCRNKGHVVEECRKRLAELPKCETTKEKTSDVKPE